MVGPQSPIHCSTKVAWVLGDRSFATGARSCGLETGAPSPTVAGWVYTQGYTRSLLESGRKTKIRTSMTHLYMLFLIHHLRKLQPGDFSRFRVEKDPMRYILRSPPSHISQGLRSHIIKLRPKKKD